MITTKDFAEFMRVLKNRDVREDMTPERLFILFKNRLSYRELVQILCLYIKTEELFADDSAGQEQLGIKITEVNNLKIEINNLNEFCQRAQRRMLAAEKEQYKALNRAVKLQIENQQLSAKLRLLEQQPRIN